jgi:hypothetical protein
MSVPGFRSVERHRPAAFVPSVRMVLVAAAVAFGSGCAGTPRIEQGTLADAKTRVVALVTATGGAIGPRAPDVSVGTADELPCKKRFLGYVVGDTGAHRAEVSAIVKLTGQGDGASLLGGIERYWRAHKYSIDRRGISDQHFPKLRATDGTGDLLVATGYVGLPQVNLYAVSPCVRS